MKRTKIDVRRLSSAVRSPGVDTRVWLTEAEVIEMGFDAEEGLFADVRILPELDEITCYIASSYAAVGGGDYAPLKAGDTVLVAIPRGQPERASYIIARYNDRTRPPPEELGGENGAPTPDRVVRMAPGESYRIIASDGGAISIHVEDSGGFSLEVVDGPARLANSNGELDLAEDGTVTINGLRIDPQGNLSTPGEVTAKDQTAPVNLSTHLHPTAMGPSGAPTPGT